MAGLKSDAPAPVLSMTEQSGPDHAPSRVDSAAPDLDDEQIRIVADIMRDILRAALAAGIAGVLVIGVGGRVVMRVATLLNPDAAGAATENGNLIGDITVPGTLALVFFSGLLGGLLASVVWTTVVAWLPRRGARRAWAAAAMAVALAGFFVIRADNHDFFILRADLVIIAMFIALIAAFGIALSWLDERLDGRLPRPAADPRSFALRAMVLLLVGAVLVLPRTIAEYASESACLCSVAPIPLVVPLGVAGTATLAWWVQRVRGRAGPSIAVQAGGRLGTLAAAALGLALLAVEVAAVPV